MSIIAALTLTLFQVTATEIPVAKPEEVGLSARKLHAITEATQELIDKGDIAGAVNVVVRKGHVVHWEALGMADIAAESPMKRDTILRFYSMSKPITSVAVLCLVEDELIALDDRLSDVFDGFANIDVSADGGSLEETMPAKRPITIRDLLRHTSGMSYGVFGNSDVDKAYRHANLFEADGLMGMIEELQVIPLLFQPGERWHYGINTDVLGAVVEAVSGQPFEDFLHERIFEPLGMVDTSFFVPENKLDRYAANYTRSRDGKLAVMDRADSTSTFAKMPSMPSGGGGLVSTAGDYARFCLMLLGGGEFAGERILTEESVAEMTKNQLGSRDMQSGLAAMGFNGVGFGLGFSVRVEESDAEPLGEYGWAGAASTSFSISPNDEMAIITLTQFMPMTTILHAAVKPLAYAALLDQ